MEEKQSEITEAEKVADLPSLPPPLTVGIAVDGKKKSKYVVKWALEKFGHEEKVVFKILHVRPKVTLVPTPMGNSIPISQVRDSVAKAYRKEMEWKASQLIVPYKDLCTQRKVQVDVCMTEADNVANAIAEEVSKSMISKLVIGASSRGMFSRKLKAHHLSSRISACAPRSCTVYVVSKGKLASLRPSDLDSNPSIADDSSVTSGPTTSDSSNSLSSHTDGSSGSSYFNFHSSSLPMQRVQALATINQGCLHSRTTSPEAIIHSRSLSLELDEVNAGGGGGAVGCTPSSPESAHLITRSSSFSADFQSPLFSDEASASDGLTDNSSSDSQQANFNFELEKLRLELRHARGVYAMAQTEAMDASRKLSSLNQCRMEGAAKLKEISSREEKAKELAQEERGKCEAALKEAEHMRKCAEKESMQRREAEAKAKHDAKEKERLQNALVAPLQQYRKFTWEEIESATSSFSEALKIGMGAYGKVYKCSFHHTVAAVKVLHSKEPRDIKQFKQELDILSKICHPHLLILLGACPDHGCLVYEYMENGSLEDRLLRLHNTQPIPWFERFRIAWEVASALAFLHNSKPEPIIHRDLKPANILLDHNYVSKIGDVGLSTMLHSDITMYKDTAPVGTLCYIDPEYQRTGLISPKSDVYALGMVILQLLTGKPAMALAHLVERAMEEGQLARLLDSGAGNWPVDETEEIAKLGLSCAELRRKDRPCLKDGVLPALERLKEVGERARERALSNPAGSSSHSLPPNHFVCPILKEVMKEPCVAADGYTYEREAIERWLQENEKSPMTNVALSNKNLLPNYTILAAIVEWKSK
ncbi:unnamed protein product [Linum tenue]|uniref:RING-type E3 ubiquitin transferase n=1 Tax=Linum tenue TaxID=586396 RepID=A0AAV0MTL3_9ROSI|nr:unnamed protein product [Linum tenue]